MVLFLYVFYFLNKYYIILIYLLILLFICFQSELQHLILKLYIRLASPFGIGKVIET